MRRLNPSKFALFTALATILLLSSCSSNATSGTASPSETPAQSMTEEEAKALITEQIPKAEIFYSSVFNGAGFFEQDENTTIPGADYYQLVVDDNVKTEADLKAMVEEVLTPEAADIRFYSRYLDNANTPPENFDPNMDAPLYYEYEGQLYVHANNGGHGYAFDWVYDSIEITELTQDHITAQIDRLLFNEFDETCTIELERRGDKWLIANDFIDQTDQESN